MPDLKYEGAKLLIQSFNKYQITTKIFSRFLFITIFFSIATMTIEAASVKWKSLPLRTQAQKNAGLAGGEGFQMVQSISYAPSNPNVVYMVVDTSQVWKSVDGGFSWKSKRNGFRSLGGVSLVVDPLNENVVFVSGALSTGGSPVDGIYRTLNGGDTWELVKQTYYSKKEGVLAYGQGQHYAFDLNNFDGTRHKTIYAGTNREGMLKSIDGGDTWTTIGLNGKRILDIDLVSTTNINTIYVATTDTGVSSNGLYKIVDDGKSSPVITPIGNLPDYPRTIAIDTQSDPKNVIIYAAVGKYKVYKSTDGGNTFSSSNNGLKINDKDYQIIEISPADPKHLYVKIYKTGSYNPFYSLDGGATWNQPTDLDDGDLSTRGKDGNTYWSEPIAPHPSKPNIALAYLSETVMKTTNGGKTWVYSGNGYMGGRHSNNKTSAYFDAKDPNRKIFFLTDFGPVITEDGGGTWRLLPVPRNESQTTPVGAVDPENPNLIITAVGRWKSQIIVRSTDGGINWTQFSGKTSNFQFMSFHPQASNYVYAGGSDKSFISNNKGKSWTEIPNKSIRAMFLKNGDIVYAIDGNELYLSTDKGSSWTKVADNPFLKLHDMDIDPTDSDILYAATSTGLYAFNGTKWTEIGISNGIPTETFGIGSNVKQVHNVVVDPNNPNTIYAGMWAPGKGQREKFIFRSMDSGLTWEDIRYNLEGYSTVWSLAVDPNTSALHMCTDHGNYVLSPNNSSLKSPSNFRIISIR